ncbi:MAG TPA: GNAT family N-acetyltransferase [Gemmatimonadaceae bacterium]|jgi:GNAT superfamily N-acetyltransferase|nr:GNAT family N-acetyltransferase [Gemmatimonadaceae bacterium]
MVRVATLADVPSLQSLIAASVRALSATYYTAAQIDASIAKVFGVDTQLIADATYYVIDSPSGPAACGGWSHRRTLYGGDQLKESADPELDSASDAARIRAFFVHPDFARRGLARALYAECESAARAAGFRRFELMSTLPGEPLYVALGFAPMERVALSLGDGLVLPLVRMGRAIGEVPTNMK